MNKLLLGLSVLPFLLGAATAAESLSDRDMDQISAGDTPGVFSTSNSMSTDGTTVTTSTTGLIGGGPTGGGSTGTTQKPSIFQRGGVFGGFNVMGAAPPVTGLTTPLAPPVPTTGAFSL